MIQSLLDLISKFTALFIWWTVVEPWEQSIRVRLGSDRTRLGPGLHFRIPYADVLYTQTVRTRYTILGAQTLTTTDGQTITLAGSVAYKITDLDRLYDTLQHPEDAIQSITCGRVSEYVQAHAFSECSPGLIVAATKRHLDLSSYGLDVTDYVITSYVRVRTYRIINDSLTIGAWGDMLNTSDKKAGVPS